MWYCKFQAHYAPRFCSTYPIGSKPLMDTGSFRFGGPNNKDCTISLGFGSGLRAYFIVAIILWSTLEHPVSGNYYGNSLILMTIRAAIWPNCGDLTAV